MSPPTELEQHAASLEKKPWIEAILTAEEYERRLARRRLLTDMRFLAETLYPPEDSSYRGFWERYSELTEWLLQCRLAFKSRQSIDVLPGFEVVVNGRSHRVEKPETFDLSRFNTLHIRQSRETLKTGVARIDAIHDLYWWPEVRGVPAAVVWWGFKLERAYEAFESITGALPKLNRYFPEKFPETSKNFGVKQPICHFNVLDRPEAIPERSIVFLAIRTKYTGGRWKSGHGDDLVNEEDWVSPVTREERARDINAREFERDKLYGIRTIQGTDWHIDDAHNRLEKRSEVFTVKMPCLRGSTKAMFEFFDLPDRERRKKKTVELYTEKCQPMFPHLTLEVLRGVYETTTRELFFAQMLLDARKGGNAVFRPEEWLFCEIADVGEAWPCALFTDPALKSPDNLYQGDYLCTQLVKWDKHGRRYVIDGAYRNDWGVNELFNEWSRLITMYRPFALYMPKREADNLQDQWQKFALRNHLPIAWISHLKKADVANKMARIKSEEPDLRSGRVVLLRDHPVTNALVDEAKGYDRNTGSASHDDALDTLSQSSDPAVGEPLMDDWGAEPGESEDRWNESEEICHLPGT
jgi:predicted phage terminase large subunit-like protein